MFVDNQVVKKFEGEDKYDKFSITSTLMDVSFKGASCSLLRSKVLSNCNACNLKYLCGEIDEVVKDFTERTTVVTDSFSFQK